MPQGHYIHVCVVTEYRTRQLWIQYSTRYHWTTDTKVYAIRLKGSLVIFEKVTYMYGGVEELSTENVEGVLCGLKYIQSNLC